MPDSRNLSKREKGIAVMLTAIMLMFTIPFVGLSIDAGAVYMVKARLQAASDAAALAAARSLNLGMTLAEQEANARARAVAYYQANFPAAYMGSTNSQVETQFAMLNAATVEVRVTTRVDTPLYFMRILGLQQSTIRALGTATRRNVNVYLILDRSGSMGSTCATMKTAAQTFTNYFAAGRDQLGLIVYNSAWSRTYTASVNFKQNPGGINSAIANISCAGGTGIAQAVWQGYQSLLALNQPLALNVLVFFTDGEATALTAYWPVKQLQDSRKGDGVGTALQYQTGASYTGNASYGPYSSTSTLYTYPPSSCQSSNGHYWYRDLDSTAPARLRFNPANTVNYTETNRNPDWMPAPSSPPGVTYPYLYGVMQAYTTLQGLNGSTLGITSPTNLDEPYITGAGNGTGCAFNSSGFNWTSVRRDVAFIPATDAYGNSTRGYKDNYNQQTGTFGPSGQDLFTTPGHPYLNQMRPDQPATLKNAAFNAADHAGMRVRSDTTYNPMIYCIGLGGNPGQPPDTEFMSRLANDASANDTYTDDNMTRPRGIYVYAPNATQLSQAFIQIASSVLRLSQ